MKNQGLLTRVMCTFVFTLFCFYYLYCYQADLLTVMQHVLSQGQTHYNHFVGAVLITLVVLLIQIGVVRILQRKRLAWALTFVRSLSDNAYQYWGVSRQRNARVWCVAIHCASADSCFFLDCIWGEQ